MTKYEIQLLLERSIKCFEDMEVGYDIQFYGEEKVEEIYKIIEEYHNLMQDKK